MSKYRVIRSFRDIQDNDHVYSVGDWYPRRDDIDEERAFELSNSDNKLGEPLIEAIETEESLPPFNLDDTVENLKESITVGLGEETLNELLVTEAADKNRKGVIEHITSLLAEDGDE